MLVKPLTAWRLAAIRHDAASSLATATHRCLQLDPRSPSDKGGGGRLLCISREDSLHSSVGQSARLVSVRSRVRTSVEATAFFLMAIIFCSGQGLRVLPLFPGPALFFPSPILSDAPPSLLPPFFTLRFILAISLIPNHRDLGELCRPTFPGIPLRCIGAGIRGRAVKARD